MGRDNNTYAKRQREILKRQKAEDKLKRRQKRKTQTSNGLFPAVDTRIVDPESQSTDASQEP
jgi:hypothetical protein